MITLEPMAAHDGPNYQPVVAIYTDDNTITMRRLPGRYATKTDAQRQAREHIADAIAYARVTDLGLPLNVLSKPDMSNEAQIRVSLDDWFGS
jgi:hypothetical protein